MIPILERLRDCGWTVAVHNDYRLTGFRCTFWLLTHEASGRFVKGEGLSDEAALAECAEQARELASAETVRRNICAEICSIMDRYDEQAASARGVDTPGGLEHMGDVWGLLGRWRSRIRATAAQPPQ